MRDIMAIDFKFANALDARYMIELPICEPDRNIVIA